MLDPLLVSVFTTIVLIVISVFSTWQNRQTIFEMEKARKAEFMPHIRAELSLFGPVFLILKLTNFGKGPATNVKAEITFLPSGQQRQLTQTILSPDESFRIYLPEGSMEKAGKKSAKINVKGTYTDIFGKNFEVDETIDTNDFIEKTKQLRHLVERDLKFVDNIKDELHKINKAIRQLGGS